MLLTQDLHYPERDVFLEGYIIIEENGAISDYRNWHKYFSEKTIKNFLEKHGFQIDEIWGNFSGDKYKDTSQEMGINSSI